MHNRRHFKLGPTEWRSKRDLLLVSRFQLNHFHFHFNLRLIALDCLKLHTRAWKCTKHSPQRLATDVWSSTPHFRVIFQKCQRIYNASLFWPITVFLSNDELTADSRSKLLPIRWLSSFFILCWSTMIGAYTSLLSKMISQLFCKICMPCILSTFCKPDDGAQWVGRGHRKWSLKPGRQLSGTFHDLKLHIICISIHYISYQPSETYKLIKCYLEIATISFCVVRRSLVGIHRKARDSWVWQRGIVTGKRRTLRKLSLTIN